MAVLPFAAFVGLEELKRALLCLAVDPSVGGLLIVGPKGTGKSSIVRAFAELLPEIEVSKGCPFNCDPKNPEEMCDFCRERLERDGELEVERVKMRVVELPIGATEDMVLGTINIERTLKEGRVVFEVGLLGRANRQILYVDEVNLLPDYIVDSILDAAASGWNVVEREGISLRHPAKFILVGTMNPEEGELRPQLLDRFSIGVKLETIRDPALRAEIVKRNLEFEEDPEGFRERWKKYQVEVSERVRRAREILRKVRVGDEVLAAVAEACARLEVDGYRPDIIAVKVARVLAALDGREIATVEDALAGLELALAHRTRASGLKRPPSPGEIKEALLEAYGGGRRTEARKKISKIFFREQSGK